MTTEEEFTPTAWLVMEVLAARWRLGEKYWTFPTRFKSVLENLEARGMLYFKSGIAEGTFMVWLTDKGRDACVSPTYDAPSGSIIFEGTMRELGPFTLWVVAHYQQYADARIVVMTE